MGVFWGPKNKNKKHYYGTLSRLIRTENLPLAVSVFFRIVSFVCFFFPSYAVFFHSFAVQFSITNNSVALGMYVVFPARKHQTLPTTVNILNYTILLLGLKLHINQYQ